MSDVDFSASCEPAADGGLDGAVTVVVGGTASSYASLADGDIRLDASDAEAAYAIDATIACDAEQPSATLVVTGVGTPPADAEVEPLAVAVPSAGSAASAQSAPLLPSTGAGAGVMLAAALMLVAAGTALRRIVRHVP